MKIVFRTDASIRIGTGHVMRCLTLADELTRQGARCEFICRALAGNLIPLIEGKGYPVHSLRGEFAGEAQPDQEQAISGGSKFGTWALFGSTQAQDAAECATLLRHLQPDWLIVDHYGLDAIWELKLSPLCSKLMVIDDLADRPHRCEILLDQNFGRTADDYKKLVPPYCQILCGTNYTLLRPQFPEQRSASLARRATHHIKHVLIQMGGDHQISLAREALSVLQELDWPSLEKVTVVLSAAHAADPAIAQQASTLGCPVSIRSGVTHMAELMAGCDLAIATGGGATYERIYMGLPSLLRPAADNQVAHLTKMAAAGLFHLYETPSELKAALERLRASEAFEPSTVVEYGTETIAAQVMQPQVTLRLPNRFDVRRTFKWLQDDTLRRDFMLREKPRRMQHCAYWRSLLQSTNQRVYSIYCKDTHVGNAGLKNITDSSAELWLYLGNNQVRGQGIGRQALREIEIKIIRELNLRQATLHVSRINDRAIKLYHASGYIPAEPNPADANEFDYEKVLKMEKYL